jgi:hypothetical protein
LFQTAHGPDRYVHPLGDDGLGAKPASMGENDMAILDNVFVEQNASLGIAQQACQRRLAVEKREIAQILTVMLDQIEGIEDRGMRCAPSA